MSPADKNPSEQQKPAQDTAASVEIGETIEVKNPAVPADTSVPINFNPEEAKDQDSDKELDGILKQVNQDVKDGKKSYIEKAQQRPAKNLGIDGKVGFMGKWIAALPLILALVIAIGLAGAAYYAFGQENQETPAPNASITPPAQSSSTEGNLNSVVNQEDVGNFAQSLDSELNSLDDNQEFSEEDLSNSTLGL